MEGRREGTENGQGTCLKLERPRPEGREDISLQTLVKATWPHKSPSQDGQHSYEPYIQTKKSPLGGGGAHL